MTRTINGERREERKMTEGEMDTAQTRTPNHTNRPLTRTYVWTSRERESFISCNDLFKTIFCSVTNSHVLKTRSLSSSASGFILVPVFRWKSGGKATLFWLSKYKARYRGKGNLWLHLCWLPAEISRLFFVTPEKNLLELSAEKDSFTWSQRIGLTRLWP